MWFGFGKKPPPTTPEVDSSPNDGSVGKLMVGSHPSSSSSMPNLMTGPPPQGTYSPSPESYPNPHHRSTLSYSTNLSDHGLRYIPVPDPSSTSPILPIVHHHPLHLAENQISPPLLEVAPSSSGWGSSLLSLLTLGYYRPSSTAPSQPSNPLSTGITVTPPLPVASSPPHQLPSTSFTQLSLPLTTRSPQYPTPTQVPPSLPVAGPLPHLNHNTAPLPQSMGIPTMIEPHPQYGHLSPRRPPSPLLPVLPPPSALPGSSTASIPTAASVIASQSFSTGGSGGGNSTGAVLGQPGRSLSIHKMDMEELDKTVFTATSGVLFIAIRAFAYPSLLVKTRMQTDPYYVNTSSSLVVYKDIINTDGVRGLFRGFAPSLLNTGLRQIYLLLYERLRTDFKKLNDNLKVVPDQYVDITRDTLSGFFASVAYQVISNPVDIVVQRMMVQPSESVQPVAPRSRFDALFPSLALTREIYRQDGVSAFYRGFVSSTMQYSISSSVWWGTFAICMDLLAGEGTAEEMFGEKKKINSSQDTQQPPSYPSIGTKGDHDTHYSASLSPPPPPHTNHLQYAQYQQPHQPQQYPLLQHQQQHPPQIIQHSHPHHLPPPSPHRQYHHQPYPQHQQHQQQQQQAHYPPTMHSPPQVVYQDHEQKTAIIVPPEPSLASRIASIFTTSASSASSSTPPTSTPSTSYISSSERNPSDQNIPSPSSSPIVYDTSSLPPVAPDSVWALLPLKPETAKLAQQAWSTHPWMAQHISAFAGGAASVAFTNPIDVCRTRLMVSARANDGMTFLSVYKQLMKEVR